MAQHNTEQTTDTLKTPASGTHHSDNDQQPHAGIPALHAGVPLANATYALVLVHGRGGSPESMLPLARSAGADDAAIIAPRADENSWYPDRFLAPIERNEPWLSGALASVQRAVLEAQAAGIPSERIVLAGFSQGACLTLEFAARHPARYGAVAALAGALIGEELAQRSLDAALAGTPVLLACGDQDAHIPESRVRSAAAAFTEAGAPVDLRIYPGLGHTVVGDQVDALRALLTTVRASAH